MELPQPRSFGTQDRKSTNNFLSLYSPAQQDPTPTPPGGYLKTHDFLQPLERVGKNAASISHISHINQSQRLPKPEGSMMTAAQSSSSDRNDENSNCSSYTGSGFTLWDESAGNKGKTGKENIAGIRHVIRAEGGIKIGGVPWTVSMEQPSQSSVHNHQSTDISYLSSSHPSSAQKNQSFVDMLKSAKIYQGEDDDEEDFFIKKEPSSHHYGVFPVKVETVNSDQKPNTPRSKHSATEQRRRSKINDRISMLREVIPHVDQKRDKASFLSEVIEYIQFLQEKVNKYEESYQRWINEPPNMIPWNNSQRPSESFIDQSRDTNGVSGPALAFSTKFNENSSVAPNIPKNGQNLLDSDMSSLDAIKEISQHPHLIKKTSPFVAALQPNMVPPVPQIWQSRSCTTDCTVTSDTLKDQELTVENGTISISTIYSQGLLSTLTEALQSSGVDLSQANISVQINLGKRANPSTLNSSTPIFKKTEIPSIDQALAHSRLASAREEENDEAFKRSKTSRN